MSAVSALANSTATIFALDIYKRMIRKDADDRAVVRVGRIASILALSIAAFLCPAVASLGGIFHLLPDGSHLAGDAIHLRVPARHTLETCELRRGGFRHRRRAGHPVHGGAWGALLGFKLHWLYTAFIAQVIIMAGVVAVSLATLPPVNEQIEKFVWRPALLGGQALEISRPWYQSVGLWFGLYAAIWFFIYWRFW